MKKTEEELQIGGTKNYAVFKDGMSVKTSYGDNYIYWDDITDFLETDEYLFFSAASGKGSHIIPLKFFKSKDVMDAFINELAKHMANK